MVLEMNILVVSHHDILCGKKDGGVELISNFAINLSMRGHHVGLVIPSHKNLRVFLKNIEVLYVPSIFPLHVLMEKVRSKIPNRLQNRKGNADTSSTYFFTAMFCILQRYVSSIDFLFKRFLTKIYRSYDIVICMFPWLGRSVASTVSGKPFIIFEHNVEWKNFNEFMKNTLFHQLIVKLIQRIEIDALLRCHHIFCVSNADFQELSKYVPREKLSVIPMSIPLIPDVNQGEIDVLRRKLGLSGKSIVLFMGSSHPPNVIAVKNIVEIIAPELLKMDPNIMILIVGACGRFFCDKSIPKNVMLVGYVNDVVPYLKLADLFINPDTTLSTGLPTKMLYYMSTGKPIITTKIGVRGINLSSYGFIVEDDLKEFANKIVDALTKLDMKSASKSNLESAVRQYSPNLIMEKCENVFVTLKRKF
jgi:glycosyltransferase involved in cell wall biosynthesis